MSLLRDSIRTCLPLLFLSGCGGGDNSTSSNADPAAAIGSTAPAASADATPDSVNAESFRLPVFNPTPAPTTATASFRILDRIDLGNAASEKTHQFNGGDTSTTTAGKGAFAQTYRQPQIITYGTSPASNPQKLSFTVAVDPTKQNYLTVKLYGSDSYFGVLRLVENFGNFTDQLDSDMSNGPGNPPFVGRFHYATTTIPLALTQGKSKVTLTLCATGYFYDSGAGRAGSPARPVYSAFTHVDPYFVPPAADKTGVAPVQVGYAPPPVLARSTVFDWMKHARAVIYNLDNAPDSGWNFGGTLVHEASVIPAGTPGAPPEVIGMRYGDGPITQADINYMMSQPNPADAWRNGVQTATFQGIRNQMRAVNTLTTVYLSPPLQDINGNVVPGYDRYLDPAQLQKLVGVYDGLTRMQSGGNGYVGGWDSGCLQSNTPSGDVWAGVTSTPRTVGPWAGQTARHDPGCISFDGTSSVNLGRSMLRLLVDNPAAASAFKAYLDQSYDADLNGKPMKRAYAYERMLAASAGGMGFGLKALTSTDLFDKAGGTASQEMIFLEATYSMQLALRQLQALFPNSDADKQAMDPATMRAIVRQIVGLDNMTFMVPGDVGWRAITKAGISEDYGTLSSGYDGRYGGAVPVIVGALTTLTKYDRSLSAQDRADFAGMARNTIAAFDNFLYPQHQITTAANGSIVDTYALGQEDVISYRVPYGPNANGWNLNLQTDAVDPGNIIQSPLAKRAFMIASAFGWTKDNPDMASYLEQEAAWLSIAGIDPATVPKLPGEPGAADFVWADPESGAFAMNYQGERLFFNANYNRPRGEVNNYVRIHHITGLVDREATVRMPFDATTAQDDGNFSGGGNGPWVVRYGHYLVAMNRSASPYLVKMPAGRGTVKTLHVAGTVALGGTATVAAGSYEVYVLP